MFDCLPRPASERAQFLAGMELAGMQQEPSGNKHAKVEPFFAGPMVFQFEVAIQDCPLIIVEALRGHRLFRFCSIAVAQRQFEGV